MKKLSALVILVIIVNSVTAQWLPWNSPTEESLTSALKIDNQAFIFGYNAAFSTTDNGLSWNTLPVDGSILCSAYIDGNIFVAGQDGLAKVSNDLGNTWNDINILSGNNDIIDIVQVGDQIVFFPYKAQWATIVDLNDFGNIDTLLLPYTFSEPYYAEFGFSFGNRLFLAAGEHIKSTQGPIKGLYFTDDFGVNWEENILFQSQAFGSNFTDAYVHGDKIYMAVNGSPSFGTHILLSEDGGANWSNYLEVEDSYFFNSVYLNEYGKCFAAGGQLSNNQIVGVTLENGVPVEISETGRFRCITGDNEQLIVVGDQGMIYAQSTTSIAEEDYFSDVTIYPNPCVNELQIRFKTKLSRLAIINIYSLDGKMIKQLKTQNDITVDLSNQPAGLYSVNINGRTTKIVKM